MRNYLIPVLAVLLAVAVTATMDFTGLTEYSALPLLGIILLFWILQKNTKAEMGIKTGRFKFYGLALLYPVVVLGICALIAYFAGEISQSEIDDRLLLNIISGILIGPVILVLTEEGFFRGWLWGALRRLKLSEVKILLLTTGAFVIWHISAVTSGSDYSVPVSQVPVYLINVALLGLIWGLLRSASGSVIVPALSHGVWNTLAYALFGYGEKSGLLGIEETSIYGPEVGYLGILINGIFLIFLWRVTGSSRNKY